MIWLIFLSFRARILINFWDIYLEFMYTSHLLLGGMGIIIIISILEI